MRFYLVVVMAQGLDTGSSPIPPGVRFPVKTSGFFQITTIFRRRCKAIGPGYLLSNGRWVMLGGRDHSNIICTLLIIID
jgi:hypothetical protein